MEDVVIGKDLKELFNKNRDCYNCSGVNILLLDDNELYMVTKTIGLNKKHNRSGTFINQIEKVTDIFINSIFK